MESKEGGGERDGRREGKEGEKDSYFLLDRKVLPQFSRILGLANVRALVEFKFPVLILTKLGTGRKAKSSGLSPEMVSESCQR